MEAYICSKHSLNSYILGPFEVRLFRKPVHASNCEPVTVTQPDRLVWKWTFAKLHLWFILNHLWVSNNLYIHTHLSHNIGEAAESQMSNTDLMLQSHCDSTVKSNWNSCPRGEWSRDESEWSKCVLYFSGHHCHQWRLSQVTTSHNLDYTC